MVGFPSGRVVSKAHWAFSANFQGIIMPWKLPTPFQVPHRKKTAYAVFFGTDGGTWTHMVSRMILSHVRLPFRHIGKYCVEFKYENSVYNINTILYDCP